MIEQILITDKENERLVQTLLVMDNKFTTYAAHRINELEKENKYLKRYSFTNQRKIELIQEIKQATSAMDKTQRTAYFDQLLFEFEQLANGEKP